MMSQLRKDGNILVGQKLVQLSDVSVTHVCGELAINRSTSSQNPSI